MRNFVRHSKMQVKHAIKDKKIVGLEKQLAASNKVLEMFLYSITDVWGMSGHRCEIRDQEMIDDAQKRAMELLGYPPRENWSVVSYEMT
jgi:hypothetical protein